MQLIDEESIKRVMNGDLIVRGIPEEIAKRNYQDGWCVVNNLRESEELELERSGILIDYPTLTQAKRKLSYGEFISNHWYILDAELH